MMKRAQLLLLIVICNLANVSFAIQSTNKLWSSFTLTGNYGTFLYNIEPQLRLIEATNAFNQFLTNAGGGIALNPTWQFWLGQTISTVAQDAEPGSVEEYRSWEQVIWQRQIKSIRLNSRTRVEQRKSFAFATWANRFRERMTANIPLAEKLDLVVGNEILVNLNRVEWLTTKTWDQDRIYVGFTRQLSKSTFLSVGGMNQWLFTPVTQSDVVLVINLNINLET